MMPNQPDVSTARERVLDVAEKLFMQHGYAGVTLRHIADSLGMKQASLYYHTPGGKEELFVAVTERALSRHRNGLEDAIAQAGPELGDQLKAAAAWLFSQPAMNFSRMLQSDLRAVSQPQSDRLRASVYKSLIEPLATAVTKVLPATPDRMSKSIYLAGAFLSIVEGISSLPQSFYTVTKQSMADYLIDTWMNGLTPR
jgi:AcrR family transcriptional regulator